MERYESERSSGKVTPKALLMPAVASEPLDMRKMMALVFCGFGVWRESIDLKAEAGKGGEGGRRAHQIHQKGVDTSASLTEKSGVPLATAAALAGALPCWWFMCGLVRHVRIGTGPVGPCAVYARTAAALGVETKAEPSTARAT